MKEEEKTQNNQLVYFSTENPVFLFSLVFLSLFLLLFSTLFECVVFPFSSESKENTIITTHISSVYFRFRNLWKARQARRRHNFLFASEKEKVSRCKSSTEDNKVERLLFWSFEIKKVEDIFRPSDNTNSRQRILPIPIYDSKNFVMELLVESIWNSIRTALRLCDFTHEYWFMNRIAKHMPATINALHNL